MSEGEGEEFGGSVVEFGVSMDVNYSIMCDKGEMPP